MKNKFLIFYLSFVIFLISCSFNNKYIDRLSFEMNNYILSKDDGLVINLSIFNSSDRDVIIPAESFFLGDYNPSPRGRRRFYSILLSIMESKNEQLVIPAQNKIEIKLFISYNMLPIATKVKKEKYPLNVEFISKHRIVDDIGIVFVNTSEMD